jgi:hypothetical protein
MYQVFPPSSSPLQLLLAATQNTVLTMFHLSYYGLTNFVLHLNISYDPLRHILCFPVQLDKKKFNSYSCMTIPIWRIGTIYWQNLQTNLK